MSKLSLRVQMVLSYLTIVSAVVFFVLILGFMTPFYVLFMDGDMDSFNFYKDLQILNNVIFQSGLVFLVLSLFLIGFDVNKKAVGIFGALFTLVIAVLNILNGVTVFQTNRYFLSAYSNLDFQGLEGYIPSTTPFEFIFVFFGIIIGLSVFLFFVTGANFVLSKRKERKS